MNTARYRSELLAMRARIDALVEDLERDDQADDASPWMRVADYARHARVDPRTVLHWIDKADPGPGKKHPWATGARTRTVRVDRVKADEWRSQR